MNTANTPYAEVDDAVETGNYNKASLMRLQPAKDFQLAENLEVLLSEQLE